MRKKIIALGNMVMCDDGIGVKVAEFLIKDFSKLEFQLILGETDINYCTEKIENNDFIIILTSSYYDIEPGSVTLIAIDKINSDSICISQYGLDLLKSLKQSNKNVRGFFITVEASEVYCNPDISPDLISKFNDICKKCLNYLLYN